LENTDIYKLVRNFISEEETKLIIKWVDSLEHKSNDSNYHLSELSKSINYSTVNRDEKDPRVRLSKRISRYFQNL
jgi:hypothetical protein